MSGSVGAVPLPRAVWRVRGEAPLSFLELTTTQHVDELRPGGGSLACVLDDKGRVLADLRLSVLADGTVLLDGETASARGVEYLSRVAPLSGCDVTEERLAVTWLGDGSALGGELPDAEHAHRPLGDAIVVRVEWGAAGFEVIGSMPVAVTTEPLATYEAARIAGGRPRYGVDVTDDSLINETPLLERAVSFTKGCYPGQESVARVRNLGRVRRVVVSLHAPGAALEPGMPVRAGDDDVGTVTSAAGEYAIATVRADALDRVLTAGDAPVAARAL